MTSKQLDAALRRLGLSVTEAAALLGVTTRAVRYWLANERPIPTPVAILVHLLLRKKVSPADLAA